MTWFASSYGTSVGAIDIVGYWIACSMLPVHGSIRRVAPSGQVELLTERC